MKLAAVSVDLDEIECYAAIHGLTAPADTGRAIYRRALPRLETLFEQEAVPATFFAIGSDLDDENAEVLRRLRTRGHEISLSLIHI